VCLSVNQGVGNRNRWTETYNFACKDILTESDHESKTRSTVFVGHCTFIYRAITSPSRLIGIHLLVLLASGPWIERRLPVD